MEFKTLKISKELHKELKVFAATKSENIITLTEECIIEGLKKRGHRFSNKK